jgi:hypothetical protein
VFSHIQSSVHSDKRVRRKRTKVSCPNCAQSKIKCNGTSSNCTKHQPLHFAEDAQILTNVGLTRTPTTNAPPNAGSHSTQLSLNSPDATVPYRVPSRDCSLGARLAVERSSSDDFIANLRLVLLILLAPFHPSIIPNFLFFFLFQFIEL